jgi:dihydropyrimidine dehydrogenase (NAD+) subunit PreA
VDGVKVDPKAYAGSVKPQPVVREEDCVGCNLCSLVCPVDGCITMVEVPPQRESVTWNQLGAEHPEVTSDWEAMERYRKAVGIDIH